MATSEWRRIAAKWSKLARQAEAKAEPRKTVEVIETEILSHKIPESGPAEL
jgi:hypothetical protein